MTDNLSKLRELEAAATPGPWRAAGRSLSRGKNDHGGDQPLIEVTGDDHPETDAALIALARSLLPDLLDLWEAASKFPPGHYHSPMIDDYTGEIIQREECRLCDLHRALSKLEGKHG